MVALVPDVMRRYDIPEPYEKLKEMTRGRDVTQESIQEFVQGLELLDEPKSILLNLSPLSYIGAAEELAKVHSWHLFETLLLR
ncbi:Adenylosuccinate lyase [Nymphaea thermarum]|nr:Adenylosuccinate lyase [Nymphaea thermarum]